MYYNIKCLSKLKLIPEAFIGCKAFDDLYRVKRRLLRFSARKLYERALHLLVHPSITIDNVDNDHYSTLR